MNLSHVFVCPFHRWGLLMLLLCGISLSAYAQTTISGTVKDGESGEMLAGASILVSGTTIGTITDNNGHFSLTTSQSTPFSLAVSFTGFEAQEVQIKGSQANLTISLQPSVYMGEEVIVSASRQPEKIQEAPAAISVIRPDQLVSDAVGNPFLSLRNVVGVDIAQAGVNSGNITLRGSNSVFQTETFVMADYRNLVLPGLGTLGYGQQPIDPIDLARVEIIKGPGSALYGPGVEAGVIHFISKDPFQYPGTTVSVDVGTRSTFQTSIRHAQTNKAKTLGYKVLGFYRRANDWELDPSNPTDSAHLASFREVVRSSLTGEPVFTRVPDYRTESIGFTGTIEYRPTARTSITGVGGWSTGRYIFRTAQGEGYVRAPRPFGQVRLQSGGLFAQAFWSYQDGRDGNSGLYTSGLTTITKSHQFEAQVQYHFAMMNNRLKWTLGSDYRLNSVDTEGTVHGRFEDLDDYSIYGAYAQADAALTEKLNLVLAGRVDRFTALDATSFSPRAGLVYKASPHHTFRATYNRAIGAPTALNLFADLPLENRNAFLVHLLGGSEAITFNQPATTSFIPGVGVNNGIGVPLAPVYGAITAGIAQSGALPQSLTNYLASIAPNIPGFSTGVQTAPALTRDRLQLSQSNMFEVGYKGLFGNKLSVTADVYYNIRRNLISAPVVASPLVVQPTLPADMAAAVAATVGPDVLANYGLTPAQVAGIYQNAARGIAFNAQGNPNVLGLIRSDQTPTNSPLPTLDISYYNLRSIEYAGVDVGLEYFFTQNLSAFGSVSWLSQTLFKDVPVGEGDNSPKTNFSLNVPDTKLKFGLGYQPKTGFNASASVRYMSAWEAISGAPFTGPVDAFTVVDAGIGYGFKFGLNLNLTATNLFAEDYRFIYGAPIIGRQVLARAVYTINQKK